MGEEKKVRNFRATVYKNCAKKLSNFIVHLRLNSLIVNKKLSNK